MYCFFFSFYSVTVLNDHGLELAWQTSLFGRGSYTPVQPILARARRMDQSQARPARLC